MKRKMILPFLMAVLFFSCGNKNDVNIQDLFLKVGSEAIGKSNVESIDTLEMSWRSYLEADSLSKETGEPIDEKIANVPKSICDRLVDMQSQLEGKTDSISLSLGERCVRLVEDIYRVVGENAGVTLGRYGRLVRLTYDKHKEEIPTGNMIKGWRVKLSNAYVIEGKSAIDLWKLDGNQTERNRAHSDFKKALELNPENRDAQKQLTSFEKK